MAVKYNNGGAKKPAPPENYSKFLKSMTGTAQVGVEKKHKGKVLDEKHAQETVSNPMLVQAAVAMVTVGGKQTINMGDYNSVSISVEVSLPCSKEEIGDVYNFASEWVSARIMDAAKEATGA